MSLRPLSLRRRVRPAARVERPLVRLLHDDLELAAARRRVADFERRHGRVSPAEPTLLPISA